MKRKKFLTLSPYQAVLRDFSFIVDQTVSSDQIIKAVQKIDKVLTEGMITEQMQYMVHPYTDVYALRSKFDFSCINFSIGYYDYHSPEEYVVIEDVFNGIEMGRKMIEELGYKLHFKKSVPRGQFHPF